jgi:HEAT repeat protein
VYLTPVARHEEERIMPADAKLTARDLVERLQDPDDLVRLHAALGLGSLGEEARPAVPVLVDLLCSDTVLDRRAAAWALRDLGEVAEEAVPALLEALEDDDEQVGDLAAQALEAIQGGDDEDDEDDDAGPDRQAA